MRTGSNIRKRADGRFEARYERARDENGKIIYGYCYGKTYEEAENKRKEILACDTRVKEMNLLIIGAGEHGQEVRELAESFRIFKKISFLDDFKKDGVLGPCKDFEKYLEEYPLAIPAIGDNEIRKRWMLELTHAGFIIPTLIHPNATVSPTSEIGRGSVIYPGSIVSVSASVGEGCIIDSGAVVGRHADVPDWTLVCSKEVFE